MIPGRLQKKRIGFVVRGKRAPKVGPWAEGIRGVLDYKGIPYTRGRFEIGSDHADLIDWTAQASVPVIAWQDEFPRSAWIEQIFLAERVQPEPAVIPAAIEDRMRMFGLLAEICMPNGFGWCRRLMLVHDGLSSPGLPDESRAFFESFGAKVADARERRRECQYSRCLLASIRSDFW